MKYQPNIYMLLAYAAAVRFIFAPFCSVYLGKWTQMKAKFVLNIEAH